MSGAAAPEPVAIVGAGPYGLSLAAHLKARGVAFRIFGTPMGTWREQMPAGMFLKSAGFASSLSDPGRGHRLGRFCADEGRAYADDAWPVPLDTFNAYGQWFQRRLVPELETDHVAWVTRRGGTFQLELASGGRAAARNVVVAVGTTYFARVPAPLDALPADLVSHSSRHRDFAPFAGRDVTVVGAGQSALESAALLHEAGADVRLVARRPFVVWNSAPERDGSGDRSLPARVRRPQAGLGPGWKNVFYSDGSALFHHLPGRTRTAIVGRALGPAGAWWLRERVLGRLQVETGQVVRAAEPDGTRVRLRLAGADGTVRDVVTDHVVAGTGYRVDVAALGFLADGIAGRLRSAGGVPVLSRHLESSVPGLHLAGLAAAGSFGPAMRFVYGADFAARRLAGHLAASAGRPAGAPVPA
jgi:thioredoxin reductase